MNKKEQLTTLLNYYFKTVWESSGLDWCSDNSIEIAEMVDLIIDIIIEEVK